MPGILPMKVIKVGNSAQSRIAQACDRCRSKKIRCDGVRPTCSQCASVGFECRTSDKLSRRAFPRGYTESLEERVRMLEAEVRELKDLLDEKDEKIDILSAMHGSGGGGSSSRTLSSSSSPGPSKDASAPSTKQNTFRVQATQLLLGVENSDSYFMGSSSGRAFIASIKQKMRESGKACSDFNPDAFLHIQGCAPLAAPPADESHKMPPRLFSDRCVNVFFQEWAPLFPVLHRPTFLRLYEEFVNDPGKVKYEHKLAQLYLVFSIAGLSFENPDIEQVANCERQWIKAMELSVIENTMDTLQCLILAILYCTIRADYRRLQHYKSIAVGLSHRLGLHQSQKRFSFGALTLETRKRVFWTLYTLDCFTAAILGLPKLLKDGDIQTEYPCDTDDEYITEKGFKPPLPGQHTRITSALALFRASRILALVLEKNYPASTSYELSLEQMGALERELDAWYGDLPQHLRLNFTQGKPSTDVTGSRSPLLALAYYYIRTLIYRPAVGSSLGPRAAPALMSISTSSKSIVEIARLLEERSMSFSFCINKCDMLAMCGLTLLYQVVDLGRDSKMMQEGARLVNVVLKTMRKSKSPGFVDLERAANAIVNVNAAVPVAVAVAADQGSTAGKAEQPASSRRSPPSASIKQERPSQNEVSRCIESQFQAAVARASLARSQGRMGRTSKASMDGLKQEHQARPRPPLEGQHQDHGRPPAGKVAMSSSSLPLRHASGMLMMGEAAKQPNLDYLELQGKDATGAGFGMDLQASSGLPLSDTEWESLLGAMEGGSNNVHNAIYGGGTMWSPDSWDLSSFGIGELGGRRVAAQSVLSTSDESLSSGEDMSLSELGVSMYQEKPLGLQVDDLDAFLL